MQTKRKDLLAVTVISVLLSIVIVIFAILQLLNISDKAITVCMPLMGLVNLCQAYLQWNISRKIAYFSIGTAIFIFACFVAGMFIK